MKILIVIGSLHGGGAERQVRYLVEALTELGDSVEVCTLKRQPNGNTSQTMPTHALRSKSSSWFRAARSLRKLAHRYDVVYSFLDIANVFTSLALLGKSIPQAWGLRSSGIAHGLLAQTSFRLAKVLSSRATLAICNSDTVKKFHQAENYRTATWAVVPNGIDTKLFHPISDSDTSQTEDISSNLSIGLVARFDPIKRHDIFFEMVATLKQKHPNINWLVAGAGTEHEQATALTKKFGVDQDIKALGEVANIPKLIASLNILVCCSDFEGSSNTILEAMACGVPVVSFDVGDATNLVKDAGIVVSAHNALELAHAVERLIGDETQRIQLGTNGRKKAIEQHTIAMLAANTRDSLQTCIEQHAGASS